MESIMRRKLTILTIAILLLVGGFIFFTKVFNRAPKQGVLKVNSTPQASVYLDNKNIGKTPFEDKVIAGEYTVRVVPDSTVANLASWQGKVTVGPNLLTFINRNLTESELTNEGEVLWLEKITSKQSEVSITTTPDGATVQLDEQQKGISPKVFDNVTAGDHVVVLTSPGFVTRTLRIKTTAGYKLSAAVQLALSPNSTGTTPNPTPVVVEAPTSITGTPVPTLVQKETTTPIPTLKGSPTPTPKLTLTPTTKTTPTPTTKSGVTPTPVADPAHPFVTIKSTPTGFLRVRLDATTSSTEVGRVDPGSKFTILEEKIVSGVTWYKIAIDVNTQGWVSGQYAQKTP